MGMRLTYGMLVQGVGAAEVLEAVFADVDLLQLGVLRGVRGGEPRVHLVAAKLHHLQTILFAVRGVALGKVWQGWKGEGAAGGRRGGCGRGRGERGKQILATFLGHVITIFHLGLGIVLGNISIVSGNILIVSGNILIVSGNILIVSGNTCSSIVS